MSTRGDFLPAAQSAFPLTEAECHNLLRAATFGRVGMTSGGLPAILPVRYLYDDGAITFRTDDGSQLRAARSGDVLAFQIDAYDSETGQGWSVLALGRAWVMSTEQRNRDVRLLCEMITGQRLARLG